MTYANGNIENVYYFDGNIVKWRSNKFIQLLILKIKWLNKICINTKLKII